MGLDAQTNYNGQNRVFPRRVRSEVSTALKRGQALCYNFDRGTAADADGTRLNYVELPNATNAMNFAGVCADDYAAKTGGRNIEILEPGSVCNILAGADTTIGDYLTASALVDKGWFSRAGFVGRGTAQVLQTKTNVVASVMDGSASTSSTTLTSTGSFANAAAGDRVFIYGGAGVTTGEYVVSSVTDNDNVVLTSAPGNSTTDVSFVCISGSPTVQAKLLDGPESGLQEIVNPVGDGAVTISQYGFTWIAGGMTVATNNATATLADGVVPGQQKAFKLLGALGSNDFDLTITNGSWMGTAGEPVAAAQSADIDGADDHIHAIWNGGTWSIQGGVGFDLVT